MAFKDEFVMATDSQLMARFSAAVRAWASAVVEEDPVRLDHAQRMQLVHRIVFEKGADHYRGAILALALRYDAALRSLGNDVNDDDIGSVVAHYLDRFATEGW